MHTYLKTHTLVQPHPHQSILHQALITPHNSTHLKGPDPILPLFPAPEKSSEFLPTLTLSTAPLNPMMNFHKAILSSHRDNVDKRDILLRTRTRGEQNRTGLLKERE